LIRAHQLADSASTEDEFSQILSICQRIPANQATAEEATFGRELASWALNRRGQLRASAGRTKEALADFDTAIRLDPARWRALHNHGVLMAQAGQLERAFDDFHRTIELNPEFAKAYSNRAALYVLAGQLEPALRDYRQAAELDPKLAIAHRGIGRTCHLLGQTEEAVAHLDTAIELAPHDAAALTSRGDLLTDLGRYADAAADYERALELNANSADAYRSSAWLLATCPEEAVRNPELALQRAERAARLARHADAMTFDTLAAAQANAGDFRQAIETVRRAIEVAPPSERSLYQDRLHMYRQSTPYRMSPLETAQQARYER
jgi:tetratricopeptide (TPR) repeat protein